MVNVVFDTVVFVRSLINPHNFCGRALFQSFSQYRLFVSQPVVMEILEVLHRDELTRKFRSLAGLDLAKVIDLVGQAEVVEIPVIPLVSRDVKDNKFLATAEEAGAKYLVSQDEDLTDLKEYHGIQIVTCEEFLQVLEAEE